MLLKFVVENFKSYKDETVFSMEAGSRLRRLNKENTRVIDNTRVLKSAYLFGANASGKTTLLQAISRLRRLVVEPPSDSVDLLLCEPFAYFYKPTKFEIIFLKNGKKFKYLIKYTEIQILAEALEVDGKCIFRREGQEISMISMRDGLQTLRKNQLLLYWAQDKNISEAIEAYSWFKNDVIDLSGRIDVTRPLSDAEGKILARRSIGEKFLSILRAADFNITDYRVIDNASAQLHVRGITQEMWEKIPMELRPMFMAVDRYQYKELLLEHRMFGQKVDFLLLNESLGTQRFIKIIVNILTELSGGKLILIDEFDRSFHVEMIKVLVYLMNKWNKANQFIATTQQYNVMDFDLRPDQIYFTQKNVDGVSELYSVFDFADAAMTRNDFDYKKRYLKGLYGGTQIVNWEKLDEIFSEETED